MFCVTAYLTLNTNSNGPTTHRSRTAGVFVKVYIVKSDSKQYNVETVYTIHCIYLTSKTGGLLLNTNDDDYGSFNVTTLFV